MNRVDIPGPEENAAGLQTTMDPPKEALPNVDEPMLVQANGKIPLFHDWCSKEGMLHQYIEGCGRICSNADGNIGYMNAKIYSQNNSVPEEWTKTQRGFDVKYSWGKENIEEKIKLCPEAKLDKIWDRSTPQWRIHENLSVSRYPIYKGLKDQVFNHSLDLVEPMKELEDKKPQTREECNKDCTNSKECIGYNLYPSDKNGKYYCFPAKQGTRMLSTTNKKDMDRVKYYGHYPQAVQKVFD